MTGQLEWYPKRFGAGDIDGVGARKLLGRPSLATLSVLVRETAQNSWDARIRNDEPVKFTLHVRELKPSQLDTLRTRVFADRGLGTRLKEVLNRNSVDVLEVSDRNTLGLRGPVRAEEVSDPSTPTDYRDFVLTIGAHQDTDRGGGTYGFGKTVSYLASEASTILIWSRFREGGVQRDRLVGSALGEQFVLGERRYTGRQWWGKPGSSPDPLEGDTARELAGLIFEEGFGPEESGTSLLIISPNLRENREAIAIDLREAALWHLWPKMVPAPGRDRPTMDISVNLDGRGLPRLDPAQHEGIGPFVTALQMVRCTQDGLPCPDDPLTTLETIRAFRPKADLGELAITRYLAASDSSAQPSFTSDRNVGDEVTVRPIPAEVHHVALLRHDAELVVNYRPMPKSTDSALGLAGVFRCRSAVDDNFAAAEPPAHDAWEPDTVPDKTAATFVRVALRRMDEAWKQQLQGDLTAGVDHRRHDGGVRLANDLGSLVPSAAGGRATGPPLTASGSGGSEGSGGARRPSYKISSHQYDADRGLTTVSFSLQNLSAGYSLRAKVGFGYDGGTEQAPELVEGFRPAGSADFATTGDQLPLTLETTTDWDLIIRHPRGASLDIGLEIGRDSKS